MIRRNRAELIYIYVYIIVIDVKNFWNDNWTDPILASKIVLAISYCKINFSYEKIILDFNKWFDNRVIYIYIYIYVSSIGLKNFWNDNWTDPIFASKIVLAISYCKIDSSYEKIILDFNKWYVVEYIYMRIVNWFEKFLKYW